TLVSADLSGFDGSCGPSKPCPNGNCCSAWGWCGMTPTHCGQGCISGPCTKPPY
ncbi:hypothetical protein GQ42DRAFT_164888, partial [Ramicandelaber brevisporus]